MDSAELKQLNHVKVSPVTGVVPESVMRANKILAISKRKKKLDFAKIPLDDKKTWDLVSSGFTKGVFQLEKNLGKRYCEEIKPSNIEELSDVISLIRPGCLEAEFREKDDKPGEYSSITHTYIKVKNGTWAPEYIHNCLEDILAGTYSVPIYQEQIMRICSDFAGFSLKEADEARKAVGKKDKEKMKIVKDKFLAGAEANGHPVELADTIFGWIDKFSGYGFNKSHAVSYALIAYKTAYAKAHYPLQFFKAMLENSDGKQDSLDEIQELVHEARYFGINVKPPALKNMNVDFSISDNEITFGLAHIKGVGKSALTSLESVVRYKDKISWLKHATGSCGCGKECVKVRTDVAQALIKSGALDYIEPKRMLLLAEYKLLCLMTDRERKWTIDEAEFNRKSLFESYKDLLESKVPNKARKPKLIAEVQKMNRTLAGNPKRMSIAYEKYFLGIPLSGSVVDLYHNEKVNIKCANFPKLEEGAQGAMGVVIERIKKIKDKNGNEMAFLTVSDDTYLIDSLVLFSSTYAKVSWILEEGKPVLITGKKNKGSFLIKWIDHL